MGKGEARKQTMWRWEELTRKSHFKISDRTIRAELEDDTLSYHLVVARTALGGNGRQYIPERFQYKIWVTILRCRLVHSYCHRCPRELVLVNPCPHF